MRADAIERLRQTMRGGATRNTSGTIGTMEPGPVQRQVPAICGGGAQNSGAKTTQDSLGVPTVPMVPPKEAADGDDAGQIYSAVTEPRSVREQNDRPHFRLGARLAEAEGRNRNASTMGLTDRWCSCGRLATVALGRFRKSPANREGVAEWYCNECFARR
jgi:hypothetical protein